ncbi:unnamed protein product [Nakaseomyces glabratus]|uniref:Uncharacterized protein n=1 Tax=Candida glabrata (strain ATCC 2001 / BCRC 20586 / JCM 3761 / NBRC 0622 / NRRL Y-65 / CBS 138) TaxID=284593 RepID=Q6FR84_CANGA|nr:uncharacterized protein CAGL0H10626g [Nakaseomyces glabratus]CAG60193.1 unnamed protein product [Nakaseomyces glabratus]|eukprot:XP_447260.1 uncharacterized protein CAGL0H10626g [[Candida] glabrata]
MRFKSIFSSAALISCWAFGVAKLYQNQEIIIDSATLGSQIFEDDELMQLLNAKVTLNNFTDIRLPQGISLNSRSVLKINAPPGHGKPYSLVINGQVTIGKDSKFIFDGSSLEYESQSAASSNFKFDINTGSKGVFIFTYCTMTIKLPKLSEGLIDSDSVAAIHIGGTFEAPNINSPLSILGTLEVLTSETTVDGSFDDKLWRVDLGPDQIVEDGEGYRYILTGNIHCQAYVSVYADIFKATKTVLHALGYRGYTVVSPMTIDLSEGPVFSGGLYLYYIVLPEGQDGLTFLNFAVHEDKGIPAPTLGFMFLYSGDQTDVVATANQNIINVMNLNSKKSISVIGDHNYNITTKYSDGKSIQQQGYSGVQSYPNELIVYLYAPPSEEPDYTTTIDKGNGEFETDVVSHITTKDSDGKPTTIVTTIPWKPSEEADYTTTIDKGNGEFETDVVSHITTKDSDGKPTTIVTTIPWKPSEEADYTTTIDKGNGEFETDVVSHITTKDSDGKPTTIVTTIPLKPSDAGEADYTTTITSDGHTITEVVSHITTTDSDGNTVTYTTMMASFDQVGDGVYTSAPPYSQPPVVTTTVTEDDGSSKTVVISYSPSEGEDGVTRTGTTTISTITPSGEADYTTTIDKGNGDFETDLVSHITTKDSNGNPTTIVTTIPLKPSDAGEADYTTTITSDGHTITEVVSHITTTDSDGNTVTYTTTMASFDQVGDGVYTSAPPYSQPPVVTTTVTEDDGSSKTVVISYSPSEGEDGVTRTGTTTISTITPSGEADYTTTIDKGNGDFETDLVSHITTTDSDGKPTTIVTTIPLKPSDAGEADYTTTITSDGHTITEVVSHITTTDSDGNTVTYTTMMASFDQVGDGVYTSAPPYSQPPVVTTTVTEDDGSSKTVVISYSPSEGEDGVTRTGTTTISTITPSGEADYTTTIDKGNGDFETDLVSHITTTDSDGKPTTIITTVTLIEEPDYTSVFVSDGHTITAVVSHVTTTNDIGQTVTTTVTVMSYDQVGEGVYTSAPAYSQPPVTTTTVSANTATATVVISYFPSIGDDGVTGTGTTTVSTVSVGGEVDYTTTVDRGNGSTETDVISHITTTDSNGNPTTITTTITNAPPPLNSKANIGSDYTSTVVSNGHTIVSTVTQTVGGQSHGNTVSSAAPVTTVSGASFNAPETAGVGGIVNSQNSQSQYVADQGSGNEKPTQAPGTAGGSGSGSVHQSAGNIVPSGSPSVQSPMNTASPVNGIHSSQTPHSVPSQAQQQGQGQAQAPSSRQQAATTVLSPSGSSVNNIGSGFNSTQTASVLQGKGASIKVTSISILFSIITVIVVGMI